ncbi:unnamed protein product [Prorocentrum cordatum]|uniref:Altered inheritance of mitochondria protein 24, mitochondrial n=1 Tax=Prorocentrum cordatum TaxID=2364126 RepID=A0ABN9PI49_9DINO|nr:unnamed protein product [Polarella glacialis]
MRECFAAVADENTLLPAAWCQESWQEGADCLDTSMYQSKVFSDVAFDVVKVAAWNAFDKLTGNESRLSVLAEPVISNATREFAEVPQAGTSMGGVMWAMVIAMSLLAITCIFCSMRMFEQRTTNPPPLASASKKGGMHTTSATSLSSEWPQRKQPPVASSRSYGSMPASRHGSVPTSARSLQAGRALSMKIQSNGSSGSGAYGKPDVTPHSSLSMYADQGPLGQKSGGGSLFTVPVDSLVDVTGKGSVIIRDTFTGSVLRAAVSQNLDGSRKVQVFQGEDAVAPCASVEPPPPGSHTVLNSLEIRGANNVHLGKLVLQSTGSFLVHAHGQQELVIKGNEADLDLHVFSHDGHPRATVSCKEYQPGGPEQVEIHVLPGTDSVLIVACTLAILFLCGES